MNLTEGRKLAILRGRIERIQSRMRAVVGSKYAPEVTLTSEAESGYNYRDYTIAADLMETEYSEFIHEPDMFLRSYGLRLTKKQKAKVTEKFDLTGKDYEGVAKIVHEAWDYPEAEDLEDGLFTPYYSDAVEDAVANTMTAAIFRAIDAATRGT